MVDGVVQALFEERAELAAPEMLPVMLAEANVNERRGSCAPGRPPHRQDPRV